MSVCGVSWVYYKQNTSSIVVSYNQFKESREDVNDDACLGRPEHVNNRWKHWSSEENDLNPYERGCWWCWHTVQLMPSNFSGAWKCGSEDCSKIDILTNFEQKQRRMDIAQKLLTTFKNVQDLLKKVITGDESCVYNNDIEIKGQSSRRAQKLQKNQDRKKHIFPKWEGFLHCFLQLQWGGAS